MDTPVPRLNIVLVEDHDVLRQLLQQALQDAGHQVVALSCAEELEDQAGGEPFDMFLVDLNLPGESGLSLAARVRAAYPLAWLIIITARSRLEDKLDSYASGADLYLAKPIEAAELCAAVAAFARRRQRAEQLPARPEWTMSLRQMTLRLGAQPPVRLSAAETSLLAAFVRAPGQRVAYWQLAEILGMDVQTYAKASLEVRIVRLRKKLVDAGALGSCIEAVRNHGYQLCISLQIA